MPEFDWSKVDKILRNPKAKRKAQQEVLEEAMEYYWQREIHKELKAIHKLLRERL